MLLANVFLYIIKTTLTCFPCIYEMEISVQNGRVSPIAFLFVLCFTP